MSLILSCEHASGRVPPRYAHLFASREAKAALGSHRGIDLGALPIARALSRACAAPLLEGQQTRLLIDLNRSPGHPGLFSTWSRRSSAAERARLEAIHAAHRHELSQLVRRQQGRVVHIGVHSFTPVLAGKRRDFDVGLLYDPSRAAEVSLATRLRDALDREGLRVRRNAPYRGVSDGATTWLRRSFPERRYVGLELELNQALLWPRPNAAKRRVLLAALVLALEPVARSGPPVKPRRP